MKKVQLILINPEDDSKTTVVGEFTDEEVSTLKSYATYVEKLNTAQLLVRGISGISGIKAFGPEGMEISCPEYTDAELREVLLLLRPLILQREFASFQKVQSIIQKGFKNILVSNNMKMAMRRFEHGELSEYLQVSVAGHQLFDKSLVNTWLYSEQYHTDKEKIDKWEEITQALGEQNVRAVTMSHVLSMIRSIKFVEYVAGFIIADENS